MFRKKLKDPVDGIAKVLGVGLPTESQGRVMRIRLQLLIEAPGLTSHQVNTTKMVNRKHLPQAGMVVPVTVDRADPDRFTIDWDAAPTRQQLVDAQAQAIVDAGGIAADASVPAEGAGTDRLADLERVAALHAAGVLSDEEFAAEKARVLGQD
ncbi:MAG: SHOCT domain-containing protein [Actinomycetota bacterium]